MLCNSYHGPRLNKYDHRKIHLSIISDKVILFVSDGKPTDRETAEESTKEILRVISEQNALLNNSVTIQTFGVGKGEKVNSDDINKCKILHFSK